MAQTQSQLDNLSLQIQDIKKGKNIREYAWFTRCKMEYHHRDLFPYFQDYLPSSTPNTLNSQGMPWCRVCQTRGDHSKECLYLQKIVSTPTSIFFHFCRYVVHDEKDCREY